MTSIFPETFVSELIRLSPSQKTALSKLGITTVRDLLYHFPARYSDIGKIQKVQNLRGGDVATVYGTISKITTRKAFRSKVPMAEGVFEDDSGKIKVVWFNQAYIAKMFPEGSMVMLQGKITDGKNGFTLANPEIEKAKDLPIDASDTLFMKDDELFGTPVYPESRGITSRWFHHAIQRALSKSVLDCMHDPIPDDILKKYHLPSLKTALVWIHGPQKEGDAAAARKRFAFEEIFFIQLSRQKAKKEYEQQGSYRIDVNTKNVQEFTSRFPFTLTQGQQKAIRAITDDFQKDKPMLRLLEGDVGSGKTAVAAATSYAVISSHPQGKPFEKLQVAYMAPTEILATQLYQSFVSYFSHLPVQIGLITSSGCKKFPSKVNPEIPTDISRTQLLKWVENGEIDILVGTHSLIAKSVKFKNLAYVVIDEQHRFGVNQRAALNRGHMRTERGHNAEKDADTCGPKAENAEKQISNGLIYKDLTYTIRNCIFTVKKELGSGHKEVVYQRALEEEFKKRDISFNREVHIPVLYNRKKIGIYQPDFVVEDSIIVELKALPFVGSKEKKQLWQYLKGSTYPLGLLVNFGSHDITIDRVIYETARATSSSSAFDPHMSASSPHFLSMTATPIPRTLALTIYGDLDLTLLDEMPHGRKPVITEIVPPADRERVYAKIHTKLTEGKQLYVICPRIDAPDPDLEVKLDLKSVTEEATRLKKKIFPDFEIDILHSKMAPKSIVPSKKSKESVMRAFAEHRTDILVATSVVEVGVNVPNATIIIIEGAERFGLAQLHQLRGRVIRSNDQAYCYVFADTKTQKTLDRLQALKTAKNGFELSELDLQLRGSGGLAGKKQWGISDIGMEAIKNIKMVEAARTEATALLEEDMTLKKYPLLAQQVNSYEKQVHFE